MWARVVDGTITETSEDRPNGWTTTFVHNQPVMGRLKNGGSVQLIDGRGVPLTTPVDVEGRVSIAADTTDETLAGYGWLPVEDQVPDHDPAKQRAAAGDATLDTTGKPVRVFQLEDIESALPPAAAPRTAEQQARVTLTQTQDQVMTFLESGTPVPPELAKQRADARQVIAQSTTEGTTT